MASIIPGYNYDIFISYRQKDNKYDGWVTEFVDNLKRELESMFKDEVTVYFDINPSDYLLETYDVDASLKDKLKCLVFIPIISRTYCDPKAFAWENEFKAFINQASKDKFGLKIALPNGNITSRLLPVRINDLDPADIKLCESESGGVFRGVDFIYKEPGVNRPLRSNEENPHDNLNHTIYRNQINKVALAIREIIESLKGTIDSTTGKDKEDFVQKAEEKKEPKVEKPVEEISKEPETTQKKEGKGQSTKRYRILVPIVLAFIILTGVTIILLNHYSKVKRIKETAVLEIEQYINSGEIDNAFNLVQKAEKYMSDDPRFRELSLLVVSKVTILTDPPGADVYIRDYSNIEGEWKKLGTTPIDSIKVPGSAFYQTIAFYSIKIEKEGYDDILAVMSPYRDTMFRKLFLKETMPDGMVYVEGLRSEVISNYLKEKNGFFFDRYEVTNKQFKEFVDNDGYDNPEYWKHDFVKDGKTISRDEAIALFVDKTGRPGPATWETGDYPDGMDNYPVSGISWYEADAYAEYAGKSLPTYNHWVTAAGYGLLSIKFFSEIYPLSNFNTKGPEPVGQNPGITYFGAYDMAGNVREWCSNETPLGHIIHGGGWDDPSYRFTATGQLPSFDRSPENGFRCAKYIDKEKIPESAFDNIDLSPEVDFMNEKPVPESTFNIYRNQFLYDSTDLDAVIENRITGNEDWDIEKISFNAAYGKERVIAYLYLPKNVSPPYQTLIFFPGSGAQAQRDLVNNNETNWFIDYLLVSGHAVMFPVYKGTFERSDEPIVWGGRQFIDWLTRWVKDFRRSVDYLETRPDIDKSRLGYYGHSWGGMYGAIIPAVENRLSLSIVVLGGLYADYPEVAPINYISRIKIPVLMLGGKYDYAFDYEKSALPFFKLLGTPEKDKRHVTYDTDHYIPKNEMIKEVLNWLDKYFGPVKHISSN